MGKRGIGAKKKPLSGDIMGNPLRTVMPWHDETLSRVEKVVAFLEDLPITAGKLAGTKMKVRPWQRKFLEAVYHVDEFGNRPVRTAILSVARKNGKSGLVAGLALCHLCGPESETRGQVYSCAGDRFQAGIIFNEMKAIIERHPEIEARCNVIRFSKQIEVETGEGEGSIYAALSSDASTKLGLSPSMIIEDETGYWPKSDLHDAMDTAMGAREEPLLVSISTQAATDDHFFSRMIDYGIKVNEGEIDDPHFHLTLYTAPETMDPFTDDAWALANPALGDFRSYEDVERQAAQAKRMPSKEQDFRNKILNQRVDAHVRFVSKREWQANGGAVDVESLAGRTAFGGLDLSASRDLTAWVLSFPNGDGSFDILPRFFLPEEGIQEKSDADRVPYAEWAKAGFLTLLPGKTLDPAEVARAMAEVRRSTISRLWLSIGGASTI